MEGAAGSIEKTKQKIGITIKREKLFLLLPKVPLDTKMLQLFLCKIVYSMHPLGVLYK